MVLHRYNMSLFEAVAMTLTGNNFTRTTAFMRNEKVKTYEWVFQLLKNLYFKSPEPLVIITDKESSLISMIYLVFNKSYHILCRRH